jgi:serine/threonine-protein kinase
MTDSLSPERWSVISPLLDEALDLAGEERPAWLASLRARDPALADEVESLLGDHGVLQQEGFLEVPPPRPPPGTFEGQVLGAYTLRSLIGQGGMGSVWLAERSDGRFQGVAAVKLLNASLVGREGEARFRREGDILARLRHRHIAHLIDAGLSPSGQPYLVLERVEGEHIHRYCDARHLTIAERIRLFLDVTEAVSHAHANLIVHRDLKPSNVLVGSDGQVKLLDFGIAKLLDPDPAVGEELTREGESVLTPQYAAPEQLTGGQVTTATDVYALGVLLYLLLCGRHPVAPEADSVAELVKAIVDTDPRRPSDVVVTTPLGSEETAEDTAARRNAHPRKLRALLRGDLDNIVSKALSKVPAKRYPSVEAMADDLRRHLRHEPVAARPDAFAYRAGKFVRRNRVGVVAAVVVSLAILAGTLGVAWQAREAQRQRDAAQAQFARATLTNEFMGFLLSVAAPAGKRFDVTDLLEQGEKLIDRQFAGNDPMRVEMLVTVGRQHIAADRWDKARPNMERAAEIALRSADPALRARALCPLAVLKQASEERRQAADMMRRALAELPDEPQYALQRAECLVDHAAFGYFNEDAEHMIRNGSAALEILDETPLSTPTQRIEAQAALAYGYYLARRNREADEAYARLIRELERYGRDRTMMAATVLNNWGLVHYQGDIARAEPLYRRCMELHRSIAGSDSIPATATFNYAGVLLRLARYPEAERLFEEAIRTAGTRGESRIESDAMMELADLYIETGDLKRASAQLASCAPRSNGQRPDDLRQAQLAFYTGRLAWARGEPALARTRFTEAIERLEARQSKLAISVFALIGLARAEQALGDGAAAVTAVRRAIALAESFVEKDAPSYLVGLSRLALGDVQLAKGERDAARVSFRAAAEHLRRTLGPDHPATREAEGR